MMTRRETAGYLAAGDRYLILTHRRPDGDTAGCAAALCLGLRSLGKQAHILRNPEITRRYAWLHEGLTREQPEEGDTLISVDVAAPGMIPQAHQHLKDRITLRIDHHLSATGFTPLELVDAQAASCAEIIWDILQEMQVELTPEMARAIYVGTSTDTGCFRFSNTTAHSFLTAAACAAAGAPVYALNQELFETNSLARLRMQGWMVEHTRLLAEGKLAVCAIPAAVEAELGADEDDMDNISSYVRTIAGVCMAATLREHAGGTSKVSVRAVPGYDASAVCARFGGGGHAGAAGAEIKLPLRQAAEAIEAAMLELEQKK